MDDVTPLTQELDAAWRELEADALASDGPIRDRDVRDAIKRNRARIEAAAARRAIEGSGVVEALEAFMVAFEETGDHEHERDDDSIDLCIPIAPLKPVYWAACAAVGHRWTVVDVEPFCERCGFREGDDEDDATLTAVVQSAEHHPGDCAAVEEAGSSPALLAALPRPEEPRVYGDYDPVMQEALDLITRPEEPRVERSAIPGGPMQRRGQCDRCGRWQGESHAPGCVAIGIVTTPEAR